MELKLLLFLAVLLPHLAGAEEIAVGRGERIQDAIEKAMPGDVIAVQSGTYYENLNVNKMLTLLGVDTGGGKPVIDGRGMDSAVTLSEDGIRFEGFTVTNSSRPGIPRFYERLEGLYGFYESNRSGKPEEFYKIESEGIGPQLAFAGILINSSGNCTIENNTAISNDVGIHLWKADHNMIINNSARENTYAGIALSRDCRNNSVRGNRAVKSISGDGIRVSGSNNAFVDSNASDNAFFGIWLWESPSNVVQGNIAHDNGNSGLVIFNSSGNMVTNNNFSNNGGNGISVRDSSNNSSISENYLSGNSEYGIYIRRSSNNWILGNNAIANEGCGVGLDMAGENTVEANSVRDHPLGITLSGRSKYNLVLNNSVSKSEYYGIQLDDSSSNIIAGNHVYRNGAGIGLSSLSDDNMIERNNASYNTENGIYLYYCRKNIVKRNRADYNEWRGIVLYNSSEDNVIEDNEVGYNNWAGIVLGECDGNVVTGNNATRNVLGGIKLQGSQNNLLFQNDLVENAMVGAAIRTTSPLTWVLLKFRQLVQAGRVKNAYDDATNHWDNGTAGNYCSDFDCTDSDGDGICDSEHPISGGESVDRYPLAGPSG